MLSVALVYRFHTPCTRSVSDARTRLLPLPQSDAEERIHKVEVENAKLEAALRHEQSKVELLQKELEEARHVRRHVIIHFNSLFRRLKFSYFYGMW